MTSPVIVRDLFAPKNSRPANTAIGRHICFVAKMHELVQKISEDPGQPTPYADLVDVLDQMLVDNEVSLDTLERVSDERTRAFGAYSQCRVMECRGVKPQDSED